jgi:hypothetical protein
VGAVCVAKKREYSRPLHEVEVRHTTCVSRRVPMYDQATASDIEKPMQLVSAMQDRRLSLYHYQALKDCGFGYLSAYSVRHVSNAA